jgi:hypothetical protein
MLNRTALRGITYPKINTLKSAVLLLEHLEIFAKNLPY